MGIILLLAAVGGVSDGHVQTLSTHIVALAVVVCISLFAVCYVSVLHHYLVIHVI